MIVLTQHKTADPNEYVLVVSFMKVGKQYYFDFLDFPDLHVNDYVIVETRSMGDQMGQVRGFVPWDEINHGNVRQLVRPATPADLLLNQQWKEREVAAVIDCREKAAEIGGYGDVKIVAAEYNYDGSVLLFFYSTDDYANISTHRLRTYVQKLFDARVEFRQVGPRDVAKIQGGFGACGIPRCCSTFLTEFSVVSITMAKEQGISLDPNEITGMCGRLRCCLTYEYEQYVEARKYLPRERKIIGTPHGEGRVVEVHPLQGAVTVRIDEEHYFVTREDIIPLEEYRALQQAAASPCGRHERGGCDCGSRRPRGSADELMAEMGVKAPGETQSGPERRSERKFKKRRRNRSRRDGKRQQDDNRAEQESKSAEGQKKSNRRRSGRRRNRRRRNPDSQERRDDES